MEPQRRRRRPRHHRGGFVRLVDLDDPAGLERAWSELSRLRAIRAADPELREVILRRCERLTPDQAAPVLAALDEVHPQCVLSAYFDVLAGDALDAAHDRPLSQTPWGGSGARPLPRDTGRRVTRVSEERVSTNGNAPESDSSQEGHRQVTLTSASSIRVRPVRWLWLDRIALGTLALLGGREGIGKSLVSYWLCALLTRGRLPGVYSGRPRSVIVAATEDSWEHTIVPRLMAAGADLERVYRVDVTTAEGFTGSLNLPSDLGSLRRLIDEVNAGLVLFDPLISRLDSRLDTHKDAEVRRALEPLVALADQCGIAMVGIIHVSKAFTNDPLTSLMASRAFAAVARAVLFVASDPQDEQARFLGQPKNNLGRSDLPSLTFSIEGVKVADTEEGPVWTGKVEWTGEDERQIAEVLRSVGEPEDVRSATEEAAAWLSDYLSQHQVVESVKAKTEGKRAGHSEATLKRVRPRIGAGVHQHGFPRRSWWAKPGMTPDEVDAWLSQWDQASGDDGPGPVGSGHGESGLFDLTGLTEPTECRSGPVGSVGSTVQAPHARCADWKGGGLRWARPLAVTGP